MQTSLKKGESHLEIANVQDATPSTLLNGSVEGLFHLILPTLFPRYLLVALILGPPPRLQEDIQIVMTDRRDKSGELVAGNPVSMTEPNLAPKTVPEVTKDTVTPRLAIVAHEMIRL
ncbi:hypothetical protein HII31_05680 [Pseudocercospora fuligena]|uniref:Uncharacterized protein n=1 Tax=Pseudocercospora fuligena TaxID=685502 RepID=A0A8H6VLY7_9PEZI|nr:hypothetical protein HII31_05680 [Pseudocercospora fuligena]